MHVLRPAADPDGLSASARAWLEGIAAEWLLESHHRSLLVLAARAWDRAEAARHAIEAEGLTFEDRFGQPHERPEVGIERAAMNSFRLLVRELGLDIKPPAESRPPRIGA